MSHVQVVINDDRGISFSMLEQLTYTAQEDGIQERFNIF